MSRDWTREGARAIASAVAERRASAREVAESFLARARALGPKLGAFTSLLEEPALAQAAALDARLASGGKVGRLAGVPVAVKDNIHIAGVPTTCASKILAGYRAPYDATVVERLRAEDAVFIGKTNMDEFAMGSSNENSALGPARNPYALDRVPGGSSGGSAAAVAARLAPLALGSDTGGSIRQPAAFCGVVGLKPAYGSVSRYGLVAFASSLDQIGPLARSAEDAALALDVLSAHDPRDSTSAPGPRASALAECDRPVEGLTLGLPAEYFAQGLDAETRSAVMACVKALQGEGVRVRELSLPHTRYALSSYYILATSEASANLARFDGVRYGLRRPGASLLELYEATRGEGFGPEVKRRIMLGTYALSSGYYDAYYLKAQKARTLIREDFRKAFESLDLLLTPTTPSPAFRLGEKADPLQMYLSDVYTIPCNMAGIAGLSVPCGLSRAGLPLALQLLGPAGAEGRLLRAAARVQALKPCPPPEPAP